MREYVPYHPVEIGPRRYLKAFVELPWKIYRGDGHWVPPLKMDVLRKLSPRHNPFFEYGTVKLFGVVNDSKELAGRIAVVLNPHHNERYKDRAGFFGLFECIRDHEAARLMIQCAMDELEGLNCDQMVGPVNFSTNDESGILVEGFASPPAFMTNYSPPYYDGLLTACGLTKAIDSFSYEWSFDHEYPARFTSLIRSLAKRRGLHIRRIDRKRLDRELDRIEQIYNASFDGVWGFVPMTRREIGKMGEGLRWIADDDLILFAEHQGEAVGFCLTLPDLNVILGRMNGRLFPLGLLKLAMLKKKVQTARCMVLCVLPRYRKTGAAALMIDRLHRTAVAKGYKRAEMSVVLEDNQRMTGLLDTLGFRRSKRYRIYRKSIGAGTR